MAIDAEAIRRRRGLLAGNVSDLRGGLPGANAGPLGSPFEDVPPGFTVPGGPSGIVDPRTGFAPVTGGPFEDVPGFALPFPIQQQVAQAQGTLAGQAAVERRLAAQSAAGLGTFTDPAMGQVAQFGQGRFMTTPAFFSAGPGLFGGTDINDRVREIGEAVKRRLEELTGAPPNQPEFRSPVPTASPALNVRRGRFGT